jgi:hypothetical protein
MRDFIKEWGTFILVALFAAILVVLFIISECKTDSSFLRIIYGILTLCPVGAMLPWLTKRGLDNVKEDI